jgi:hypothetical protein
VVAQITKVTAQQVVLAAEIERANNRPLITRDQITYDVMPKLVADIRGKMMAWQAALMFLAFGVGMGMGIQWWITPTAPALSCVHDHGGVNCGYWLVAPTEPFEQQPAPSLQPQTKPKGKP